MDLQSTKTKTYIAVHGHMYQPLRACPFTGIIKKEVGADPFSNFNEKITAECYRPNAQLGNFNRISFNIGATLADWLKRAHPDVHTAIVAADETNHNAIAQAYNHTILPLASLRDKRTQILWGVADFEHRFGRLPRGMWLPETAVDLETLEILSDSGIAFTILAPWQVSGPVDPTEPNKMRLKDGRTIAVFIYNPLSGEVSFNEAVTADANAFAASYVHAHLNHRKAQEGVPQIHLLASDFELYGHHQAWKDQFLCHFLEHSAPSYGMVPCSLEAYLAAYPPTKEVQLSAPSSWSCFHGIDRWLRGCSCTEGNGHWKHALRSALVGLATKADALFEESGGQTLRDPWAARNDYLLLRTGWITPEIFWLRHGVAGLESSIAHTRQTLHLLEAQYWLQCSFTSCGWFFEDLDRLEPRNNVAFARRAISLVWEALGKNLEGDFLTDLAQARSWRTGVTGADLYHSLPPVPQNLLPAREAVCL